MKSTVLLVNAVNALLYAVDRRADIAGSIDDLPLSTYEDKGFLEVDGNALAAPCEQAGECAVLLPRGEHRVVAGN